MVGRTEASVKMKAISRYVTVSKISAGRLADTCRGFPGQASRARRKPIGRIAKEMSAERGD
ncbi:MAG: hypothetical protein A3H97_00265 [Acidobacteria bacterium RIFCSPLOWO2_02_FULL_65_29]|nr:MAG: hypothetical protein A3H97_00265 [Acidobacteria bacterium RIFCSPLOWO2_02_FULL_65_29]